MRDNDAMRLEVVWKEVETEARSVLETQGVPAASIRRSVDCRYRGQAFELEVDVPEGPTGPQGSTG